MTDRLFVGIDLGLDGALVALGSSGYEIVPMPTLASGKGKGGRRLYDVATLARVLASWREIAARELHVTAEQLSAFPSEMGANANFQRGMALGLLQGALAALEIPHALVRPQTWQKVMHAGTSGSDTKQRSIVAAQRLFPNLDLRRTPRCKILHHGIADALLLAEYGRRTQQQPPTSPASP